MTRLNAAVSCADVRELNKRSHSSRAAALGTRDTQLLSLYYVDVGVGRGVKGGVHPVPERAGRFARVWYLYHRESVDKRGEPTRGYEVQVQVQKVSESLELACCRAAWRKDLKELTICERLCACV